MEHFQGKAQVRVFDNLRSGYKKNLDGFEVEFIHGDICDRDIVRQAMKDVDYVFHLAAMISVPESMSKPIECVDIRNTHLPNGMSDNLDMECENYEKNITENGGVDMQLLGIGQDGHIGFNEPLSALQSRTRAKSLTPVTITQNSPMFDPPSSMPKRAITMGVGTVLEAKRIIMLVTGESKAEILAKAVEGPITSMISATAIQLHRRCSVIVDEAAASKLQEKDYYRWIMANEPEWKIYREL